MKKALLALTFFIFGIGISYFFFNHSIVNKKVQFNEEIDSLFDENISAQEINGKIFQLLFAYFAIDLRDLESKITDKIQESIDLNEPKVIEKVVEKIVYIPQPNKETKTTLKEIEVESTVTVVQKKNFRGLENLDFKTYLKEASPILERDKAFETFNGTHRYIGNNTQGPNFEIEIENMFKLVDKTYVGTSKINYLVLGKVEDAIMIDGMPLNFLKNSKYPRLIAARISKDRYIILNTNEQFYNDGVKGVLFVKKGEAFKRDGLLRLKSKE